MVFEASSELISEFFIAIWGIWKSSREESIIITVYGPHDDVNKWKMWESLDNILGIDDVSWVFCGDFNEVRDNTERLNCEFLESRAKRFNEFIERHGLVDVPLGGQKFARVSKDGRKMRKLDRFLVSNNFLALWSDIKVVALDRGLSGHCLIVLSNGDINFRLKPFKVFDEWFRVEGVEKLIEQSWVEELGGNRKDCIFRNKFKRLKGCLKDWSKGEFRNSDADISEAKMVAMELEIKVQTCVLSNEEYDRWLGSRKKWLEKEKIKTGMLKQKARVKWTIDGDENPKYFHNSIKRNYNKNNIRGICVNGNWCEDPDTIKENAFNHFKNIFEEKNVSRPSLEDFHYPSLSME
ncbi:uncharacterized protein [Rutidosis leptorrhynchoides]|uniref:uncharacterized protein n=1 Tax=Rutidosis leptorrhynchoides TaxID=125765 RepID=UPI003A992730